MPLIKFCIVLTAVCVARIAGIHVSASSLRGFVITANHSLASAPLFMATPNATRGLTSVEPVQPGYNASLLRTFFVIRRTPGGGICGKTGNGSEVCMLGSYTASRPTGGSYEINPQPAKTTLEVQTADGRPVKLEGSHATSNSLPEVHSAPKYYVCVQSGTNTTFPIAAFPGSPVPGCAGHLLTTEEYEQRTQASNAELFAGAVVHVSDSVATTSPPSRYLELEFKRRVDYAQSEIYWFAKRLDSLERDRELPVRQTDCIQYGEFQKVRDLVDQYIWNLTDDHFYDRLQDLRRNLVGVVKRFQQLNKPGMLYMSCSSLYPETTPSVESKV